MKLNKLGNVEQTMQSVDFAKPLTLVISSLSRYQALVIVFFGFVITSLFLVGAVWYGYSGIGAIVFGLMTLYCVKLLVNYWQAGSTPVVQIDDRQVSIKGVVFDLHHIIDVDYKQDLMNRLTFNITSLPQALIFKSFRKKPSGVGIMISDDEGCFTLNIIIYIGRFNILGKKLKPEQMKALVNDYIDYHKKHSKAIE